MDTCSTHKIPKSYHTRKLSTSEVVRRIEEVHKNLYDLSQVDYRGFRSKLLLSCPLHGDFQKTLTNLVSLRQGCPACSRNGKAVAYTVDGGFLYPLQSSETLSGVYLMSMGDGLYKIGITKDPYRRVKRLESESGIPCSLHTYLSMDLFSSSRLEKHLQNTFHASKYRMEGWTFCGNREVFKFSSQDLERAVQLLEGFRIILIKEGMYG